MRTRGARPVDGDPCRACARTLGSLEARECADLSHVLGIGCGQSSHDREKFPRVLRPSLLDVLAVERGARPRPTKNEAPFWEALHAIADALEPDVRGVYLATVEAIRESVDLDQVRRVLESSALADAPARVAQALGGQGLFAGVEDAESFLLSVAFGAGVETMALMAAEFGVAAVDIDAFTLRAAEAARTVMFAQHLNAREANVEAIRTIIAAGFENGETPAHVARQIRDVIGLDARRAGALAKYEAEQRAAGLPEDDVLRRVEAKRREKIRSRAFAWARTGNLESATRGQLELWRQAAAEGKIRGDFDALFSGLAGEIFGPPAHPNCLCAVQLVAQGDRFVRRWIRVPLPQECEICESYEGQVAG